MGKFLNSAKKGILYAFTSTAVIAGGVLVSMGQSDAKLHKSIVELEKKKAVLEYQIKETQNKLKNWGRSHVLSADTNQYYERIDFLLQRSKIQRDEKAKVPFYLAIYRTNSELNDLRNLYKKINIKTDSLENEKKNLSSKIDSLENKMFF